MPRLPSAESFGPLPVPRSSRPIVGFDGSAVPRAMEGLGQNLWDIGQKIAQEDDAQAVSAARRKLDDWERSAIYDPTSGVAAKLGRDALDLPQRIPGEFDKFASTVAETLTTPRQRKAFEEMATSRRDQIADYTVRHALTQKNVYETGQYEADISASANRTALLASAGDMPNAAAEVAVMKSRTIGFLRQRGTSEEAIGEAIRKNVSRVHANVVGQMLDDDKVVDADRYLKANAADMDVETLLRAKGAVGKQMDVRTAVVAATAAMQEVRPLANPTDFDRLTQLVMKQESGGQRFGKDGGLLTSPKGAKGEMQVMDATMRDPGLPGVKGLPADATPDQRAQFGRDYLAALVKRYDGDVSKALAAYNGGMGRVDAAVKTTESRGASGDWLAYMPAESQDYVKRITKAFGSGDGRPSVPTLQDVHARVRATVGVENPLRLKAALTEADRQYDDMVKAKKAADEESTATAYRGLVENGGNWAALPAAVRNAVPPEKVDSMLNFGDRMSKGQQRTDWALYTTMISNPDVLKSTNLMAFRDKFNETEFKQLADKQAVLNKPNAESLTQVEGPLEVVRGFMRQAGIDPTPKDTDKKGAEQVGRLLSAYEDGVHAAEKAKGSKLTTKELREVAAPLFKPVEINRPWLPNKDTVAGLVDPTDKIAVPDAERVKIVAALRAAGRPVTSEAVLALYKARNRLPMGGN